MEPRWSWSGLLISRRTAGGPFTALLELICSGTASVPKVFCIAAGSTVTVTVAGVVPEDGEIVTPACAVEMEKLVLLPPGSETTKVCFMALRLQKFDCTRRSSVETARRPNLLMEPTGRIITPLSEIAYIMVLAELSTTRP